MKKELVKLLLVLAGAILFNIIFWQEKLALNALLFDVFIIISVFYLYPTFFSNTTVKWLLLAHIITLVAVLIHNTVLSKLAFSATLLLLVAFTQYVHRSVWYAAGSVLMNYILIVPSIVVNISSLRNHSIKRYPVYKAIRFLIIPLILFTIFFIIYSGANTVFQNVVNDIGIAIENFLNRLFSWFNWQRFGFLVFGLIITGGLLLKSRALLFSQSDLNRHNDLFRKKHDYRQWKKSAGSDILSLFMGRFANGILALKNEHIVGIICMVLLNVLLLIINCIDIIYVWFGFKYSNVTSLSDYVHEGTGLLILSILLAMAVLLFFFRGNLNFYQKNKWLRYGAYGWIIQNMILVISVLLRDYYYIAHLGLAYKRIGVLIFLSMVMFGLLTVFYKIHFRKTAYYLLRVNAWFAIVVLVVCSCLHWDEQIARYNIARKDTVFLDIDFILSLSDKALPIIEEHKDILDKYPVVGGSRDYFYGGKVSSKLIFEDRKIHFFQDQQRYTWLSWNVADSYIKKHLSPIASKEIISKN